MIVLAMGIVCSYHAAVTPGLRWNHSQAWIMKLMSVVDGIKRSTTAIIVDHSSAQQYSAPCQQITPFPRVSRILRYLIMAEKIDPEKAYVVHNEVLSPTMTNEIDNIEVEKRQALGIDYSGAHEKTDPREIKLVKKLDLWIMPM